jgi:amino acid transporter
MLYNAQHGFVMNKRKNQKNNTSLKRSLSLPQLVFYGVGTILGLGIYELLGKVGGEGGMLAPLAFLFAAILAAFSERWPELVPGFNIAEEAKRPNRDKPRAIIISLVIPAFLYLLVSTIASLGLSPEALDKSEAPLADILAEKGENYPKIISAISLVAIINGVLV